MESHIRKRQTQPLKWRDTENDPMPYMGIIKKYNSLHGATALHPQVKELSNAPRLYLLGYLFWISHLGEGLLVMVH